MKKQSSLEYLMNADSFTEPTSRENENTFDMAAAAAGLTEEQQRQRSVRKESGVSYISLNSGRRIKFESIYVAANDVNEYTQVHQFNMRTQDVIDAAMCEDILPSIKKAGVKLPVMATRERNTGRYLVFDGSRRRFSALHTGQGLHVDYTEEELNDDEIAELSHITNLTKSSSLYDQGKFYQLQKEKLNISQNALADELGIPRSTMTYALCAYAIPLPVFTVFPSKTELGRKFTQKISKLINSLSDSAVDALVAACKNEMPAESDASGFERLLELAGVSQDGSAAKQDMIGKIKYSAKGKTLTLKVPDNAMLERLIEVLNKNFS